MHHLSRFGVSLEEDLLTAFDESIAGVGYQNRSEAIRDLIRDHLVQKKVGQGDSEVIGVVTLVYDHRVHRLSDILADMQHKAEVTVNASLHIHLDEHNCLEVIVIRGPQSAARDPVRQAFGCGQARRLHPDFSGDHGTASSRR